MEEESFPFAGIRTGVAACTPPFLPMMGAARLSLRLYAALWHRFCVGMSIVIDLAKPQARATQRAAKRKQSCYAKILCPLNPQPDFKVAQGNTKLPRNGAPGRRTGFTLATTLQFFFTTQP
jgi:hypothetical protein